MSSIRIPDVMRGLLSSIGMFGNGLWRLYSNIQTTSLVDATRSTRVEPITLVSQNCLTLEYLPDINQGLLDLFIGYYLQAVSLLTTIDDVTVARLLDKLNPDRDLTDVMLFESISNKFSMVEENYKYKLPMAKQDKELFKNSLRLAQERSVLDATIVTPEEGEDYDYKGSYVPDKYISKQLSETADLSVGKLINVTLSNYDENGKESKVTIPVSFRLASMAVHFNVIKEIFTYHKDDTTFIERFHSWRSGRISFIRDLILCQDLINEKKKLMMSDKENVFLNIVNRVNKNKQYGLISDNPSLATASNLYVITSEEADYVGGELGGKFGSKLVMRKIFDNSYAMIIVVIDREWEMVSYYSRGIDHPTTVSVKDIKKRAGSKGGQAELLNILKSYNLGSTPSF
jgi:uncharacterized protein YxeA